MRRHVNYLIHALAIHFHGVLLCTVHTGSSFHFLIDIGIEVSETGILVGTMEGPR